MDKIVPALPMFNVKMCDKCEEGEMVHIFRNIVTKNNGTRKFQHECEKCREVQFYSIIFPAFGWVRADMQRRNINAIKDADKKTERD